jgi:hypothetical protein
MFLGFLSALFKHSHRTRVVSFARAFNDSLCQDHPLLERPDSRP